MALTYTVRRLTIRKKNSIILPIYNLRGCWLYIAHSNVCSWFVWFFIVKPYRFGEYRKLAFL